MAARVVAVGSIKKFSIFISATMLYGDIKKLSTWEGDILKKMKYMKNPRSRYLMEERGRAIHLEGLRRVFILCPID